MSLYSIPPLIVSIFTITVGLLVLIRGKKLIYALTTFAVFLWLIGYAIVYSITDYNRALLFARILYIGVVFIPAFSYHFTTTFLNLKARKTVVRFNYFLSCIFALLTHSDYFISGLYKYYWGYQTRVGLLHNLFLIYFAITMGSVIILLYTYYRQKKKESLFLEATRIRYVLISFFVSTFAGADFLPNYGLQLYPLGFLCIFFHAIATTYAILRHHLMDINVALTRAGIFIVVYTIVLGVPLGLTGWGKHWLHELFGAGWYWAPIILSILLATSGPFLYIFLQRRAENLLLKERRRYQEILNNLSKSMIDIRDIEKLFTAITSTITEAVKIKFTVIYLIQDEYKSLQLKSCYPQEAKSRFQELIPLDNPLIDILNQRKKLLVSEEIGHQDKINFDSGLVIPCFGKEGLIGLIILGVKQNNQMYTNDDLLVFENLSYNTSLAIENCQFWKEIEEHQRQSRIKEMDLFSYSLAHEIDNPMTAIRRAAEFLRNFLLKELNLPEEKRKEIEDIATKIISEQERVSGMVKAVEEFGKPTVGEFGPLRLEDVLKSYLELYLPQFKYHGISFTKEIPEKIPYLQGSKQELMQVLVNFSNNSIHALLGNKEKRITLKIEIPNEDLIRVIFKDNGYGISQEKMRSIFAAFTTTKASTEGRGMGLYSVRKIVERHHGKVWAESEGKGKGATFIIELPIAKDITEEDFRKEDKGRRIF